MKNTTLRAIDREAPGALRTLHGVFRFDYEKPFSAVRICGPFTLRKIRDALTEKKSPIDTGENEIALILKPAPDRFREAPLRLVRLIDDCEDFDVEIRGHSLSRGLDTYYRKGGFQDDRKTAKWCVVVSQSRENLSPVKETPPVELFRRYASPPTRTVYRGSYYHNRSYIELDKSGYPVGLKREDLADRANKLRRDRERERANAVNWSERIASLRLGCDILRTETVVALSLGIPSLYSAVHDAVESLRVASADLRRAEEYTESGEWDTVDRAKEYFRRISDRLEEARAAIEEATRNAADPENAQTA